MPNSRVCFITGASSGLGRGLALRLAREGFAIGLLARREDALEEVASLIRREGGSAMVFPSDVSVRDQVAQAVGECQEALGPVDLLVANAGVSINTRVEAFDAGEVERVIRVNLLGAVYATGAVLPGMLARGRGQIVAMSSLAGFGGLPLSAAYSASKAGMTNFFESLRIDLQGSGVDVTVITPGFVRSPMTDHNRHPMPFLVDMDSAVERITVAILGRKKSMAFPWPLAAVAWAARLLPRPLYDAMTSRIDRRKSPEAGGPPHRPS